MRLSPLGPPKGVYLGLAAVALLAAAPAQWLVERGRRRALPPPAKKVQMVELWPVLMGGFRGPMIAGLAHYAQEKEIAADVYTTRSSIRTLIELQPEFHHLWIYYSWVEAYNLTAVISPPEVKYPFIRDGIQFLEEGLQRIATLYEGRMKFVNDRCPDTREPIVASGVTADLIREFGGQGVAFSDESAVAKWDAWNDFERSLALEAVRAAPRVYKRKRATLLWTIGWTYYQKLASGAEPKQYYRRWYIRDTGKDPFQEAYRYLSLASALDVPPHQVSYHVIKTAPVHCLMDWARALAEDPKVKATVVAEAFDRAGKEWEVTLPFVDEAGKKRIAHSLLEIEVVSEAMRQIATADEKAAVHNEPVARGAIRRAERLLGWLRQVQPHGSYHDVYRKRLDHTKERVDKLLKGEVP